MRELLKLTVPGEIFTMEYDVGAQWHGHMQWEFTLFPEGNCVNYVEGASFPTPKNTVMAFGPVHKHCIETTAHPYKHRDIYIGDETLRKITESVFGAEMYGRLTNPKRPLSISLPGVVMQSLMDELKSLESYQAIGKMPASLRRITSSLIIYLLGFAEKKENLAESNIPQCVLDFIDLIQKPASLQKRLPELIQNTGYSYSHFAVLFQKHTGFTLKDYFIGAKMSRASYLLTNSSLPLLEISYEVGYESVSAFIAKFGEYFQCTPYVYRKNHLEGKNSVYFPAFPLREQKDNGKTGVLHKE